MSPHAAGQVILASGVPTQARRPQNSDPTSVWRPRPSQPPEAQNRLLPAWLHGPDNDDPRGIWSDGSTMWVLDDRDDALFGYDLDSCGLIAEYELDSDNNRPHGVWSDRVTIWVSNHDPKRLFAYRLPSLDDEASAEVTSLERVRDEEFGNLSRSATTARAASGPTAT